MSQVLRPYQIHVDDKVAALKNEPTEAEREIREQRRKLVELASLAEHPGWKLVERSFTEFIDNFRSGRLAAGDARNPQVSDAQYGQMCRAYYMAADILEKELNQVRQAAVAHTELKEELKHERAGGR